MITGKYPSLRLRRSRKNDWSRRLIEENNLSPNDFILPVFLIEGKNKKQSIKSMPGVYRYTLDTSRHRIRESDDLPKVCHTMFLRTLNLLLTSNIFRLF